MPTLWQGAAGHGRLCPTLLQRKVQTSRLAGAYARYRTAMPGLWRQCRAAAGPQDDILLQRLLRREHPSRAGPRQRTALRPMWRHVQHARPDRASTFLFAGLRAKLIERRCQKGTLAATPDARATPRRRARRPSLQTLRKPLRRQAKRPVALQSDLPERGVAGTKAGEWLIIFRYGRPYVSAENTA